MTTVIKISGKPIADPDGASVLWRDLAQCAAGSVLVHGGGVQVDAMFDRLHLRVDRVDGIRRTSEEQMPVVAGVLAGTVNQTLVGLLRAAGAPAVGLSLASTGVVETEVDPSVGGRVGRVTGGDGSTVRALLEAGRMPVVASIGADRSGGLLNVNADDAAAGLAMAIGADRLVFLTDTDGVTDAQGRTISELDPASVESRIASGEISGGMAAKVRSVLGYAARLPRGVCIASWHQASEMICGPGGFGTTVTAPSGAGEFA